MAKCECGHKHCCHKDRKQEEITDCNDFGTAFRFIRTTCADCGQMLGDKLLN